MRRYLRQLKRRIARLLLGQDGCEDLDCGRTAREIALRELDLGAGPWAAA